MDESTIAKLKNGEEETVKDCILFVNRWIRKYHSQISPEDAEEIVLDIIMGAVKSADTFRGEAKATTWLIGITIRKLIEYYRGLKKPTFSFNEEVLGADLLVKSDFEECQLNRMMADEALAQLPDDQREAYVLYEVGGLSIREIASQMDKSENAVRCLRYRAARKIGDYLQD